MNASREGRVDGIVVGGIVVGGIVVGGIVVGGIGVDETCPSEPEASPLEIRPAAVDTL